MKQNKFIIFVLLIAFVVIELLAYRTESLERKSTSPLIVADSNDPLYGKFQLLSTQGSSSCSADFRNSISSMPDDQRLQGSCCSAMIFHRYKEQVEGLKKYSNVAQIPSDPYDIPASLAKELLTYDEEMTLTPEEQKEYDKAMQMSDEKRAMLL